MSGDEMTAEVMHAIGKGVQQMRDEHASAENEINTLHCELSNAELRYDQLNASLKLTREQRDALQADVQRLREAEPRAVANLRRLDALTNGLYLYMVELIATQAGAKTKAEQLALGHVIAKLAELRPPTNPAEADELGLPFPKDAVRVTVPAFTWTAAS